MAARLLSWRASVLRHWTLALGLVAVGALIVAVRPARIGAALEAADPVALLLMLPVVGLLYLCHGTAWWVVLRRLDQPVSWGLALQVTYISQAFVFLPGGDLWRVPILRSASRRPISIGLTTAAVIFDDLAFALVVSCAMLPMIARQPALAGTAAALILPQLAIFAILLWPAVFHRLARVAELLPPVRRFAPQLEQLGPAFRRLFTPRTILAVLALEMLAAGLAVTLFALSFAAVHAGTADVVRLAFTFSAAQAVATLAVLPGALGAYEAMITAAFAVQGVAPAAAAAGALLYRTVNDLLMALVGLGLAAILGRRPAATAEPAGAAGAG